MAKLLLQMNLSLDGFVADKDRKMDWMLPESDQTQIDFLQNLTNRAGMILLGRNMATESIPHWEKVAKSREQNPEVEFAKFFMKTPKVIFSKTMKTFAGENTVVENGDLKQGVEKLKTKSTKDIIVYGGAGFVASLIDEKLIDELYLFVHPVALGKGLRIFNDRQNLKPRNSALYSNGIVLRQLQPELPLHARLPADATLANGSPR